MNGDGHDHDGFREALRYPLFDAIFNRRSRRISKGIHSVPAGSLSYTSQHDPQPLSPLEEALLIAATGVTGVTLPDMPFQTEDGKPLVGSPMVQIRGRSASSPDNAQATHFFLINDSGTYFLRQPKDAGSVQRPDGTLDPDRLIAQAEACKVKVLDRRLDFPVRQFPVYVGRNRYVSNVPGSTVLVPVIDMTQQYINGIMFLLTQDDGHRPTFIDDWNFYRQAGVGKWVRNGFLSKKVRLPLGYLGTFRIHIEADLLVQNLLLAIQAMGLGGWVHAAFAGPYLLGSPDSVKEFGPGLGFRFERPKPWLRRTVKAFWPLPCWQENPVGLDGVLETYTPPYYKDMNAAVDALIAHKYGPGGLYRAPANFDAVFKPGLAARFVDEVPHYQEEVIEVAKAVCTYIWETYGRFPAHVDAIHVPGVWVQAHHLDLDYYDQLYRRGYTETQARHQSLWHGQG